MLIQYKYSDILIDFNAFLLLYFLYFESFGNYLKRDIKTSM